MAHLTYNGVAMDLERTLECSIEPVYDDFGVDVLYQRVTLGVQGILNPAAMATTTKAPPFPDPGSVTLKNIYAQLNTPRGALTWDIGPNRVFTVPATLPDGTLCIGDPENGPTPQVVRVLDILGDKTIRILFKVQFCVTDCSKVILSNRWNVRTSTDENGFTQRVTTGRAVIRPDIARAKGLTIDQFRHNFVLPVPDQFAREYVQVLATEDGRELQYTVVDQQRLLCLGLDGAGTAVFDALGRQVRGGAIKVEGNYTAGVHTPIRDVKAFIGAVQTAGIDAASAAIAAAGGNFGPAAAFLHVQGPLTSFIPTAEANCIVRVWGAPDADKEKLAQLAIAVASDRFAPLALGNALVLVSAYLTASIELPFVEFRAEFLPITPNAVLALYLPSQTYRMMNLSADINISNQQGEVVAKIGTTGANPRLPNSSNTRGTYVGNLLTQVLTDGCDVPAMPPADSTSFDQNLQ